MKNFSRLAVSALALALIAGCGGGGGGGTDNPGGGGTDPGGGGDGTASYTVKPSVSGGGGSISPDKAVSVQSGATTEFTVTPNSDYAIASVGGTCGGTLSGNTYTTKPVTANCTVVASFSKTAPAGASIANCFTVPNDVNFDVESLVPTGVPQPANKPVNSSVTRGTFNGQSATAQTAFNADGSTIIDYWSVTSSGVSRLGGVTYGVTYTADPPIIYPANMQPGQYVDRPSNKRDIFVGYEDITLSGKTFSNACHIQSVSLTSDGKVDPNAFSTDSWVAPGYGTIKNYSQAGFGWQYTASGPSIANCYTIPKTVHYKMWLDSQTGNRYTLIYEVTAGPMAYKGQTVTGTILVYPPNPSGPGSTTTSYYLLTSNRMTFFGADGTETVYGSEFLNLRPGESIVQTFGAVSQKTTLIGFETVTLAGKTFLNTCHFQNTTTGYGGSSGDMWVAPGYGTILMTDALGPYRKYDGDL